MKTTLYPVCALFAWTVVITNAKHIATMRNQPARLATWTMYVFFAMIFTTGWSTIWDHIDKWTDLGQSNTLITMCWVVCYSANALILLQLWTYEPEQARRRAKATISGAVVVLVTMVALFLRSDPQHQYQNSFTAWYGGSVEYEAYLLVYLTTFTVVEIETIRLCRRYAKLMTRSWLRTGLITAGTGASIGLLYSITRLADIAAARADIDLSRWENVAEIGAGLGALLLMIGMTLHTWGPRVSADVLRGRRLYAYARLRPLWAAFYTRDPGIAFDDHRDNSADRAPARLHAAARVFQDPEYHIARRIVEIRDGILTLRLYLDPVITDQARDHFSQQGLDDLDLDAAIVAAQIHAALDARITTSDHSVLRSPTTSNAPADLDAELVWLLKVTRHFTRHHRSMAKFASPDPTPTGGTA